MSERNPMEKIPTVEELRQVPTQERLVMIESSVLDIKRKAAIVSNIIFSLEADGYNTSALKRRKMILYVMQVHQGLLLPEAFEAFLGANFMLKVMAALPKEEQKRLLSEGSVKVCEVAGGKTTDRLVPLAGLKEHEAKLVFDVANHRMRTLEEQAHELSSARVKESLMPARIKHDPSTGVIKCDGLTFKQIAEYAKAHGLLRS